MAKAKLGIRPIIDGRWGGVRESLEEKTMNMALAAKKLIEENVFYSDGTPFECIISPCTIGGAAEAAKCADFFSTQNVCATLSVTPCWCYGSETMDLDPLTVKAVWGFNGTERPGAVYLAAVLAAHAQRGLPAFSIYGKDVQDVTDNSIPDDVAEKILRFARCAAAVGQLRGKSYVGIGAVAMGIAGSYCDADFWQEYLGIRAEWVDMVEVTRRVELGIYDHEEYERALKWVKANCPEGFDKNPENIRHTPEQKEKEWEFVVKMTLICRDIMLGNDKLNDVRPVGAEAEHSGPKDGWHEEALGRNAILGGFQGQRQWTDFMPNGDFTEYNRHKSSLAKLKCRKHSRWSKADYNRPVFFLNSCALIIINSAIWKLIYNLLIICNIIIGCFLCKRFQIRIFIIDNKLLHINTVYIHNVRLMSCIYRSLYNVGLYITVIL